MTSWLHVDVDFSMPVSLSVCLSVPVFLCHFIRQVKVICYQLSLHSAKLVFIHEQASSLIGRQAAVWAESERGRPLREANKTPEWSLANDRSWQTEVQSSKDDWCSSGDPWWVTTTSCRRSDSIWFHSINKQTYWLIDSFDTEDRHPCRLTDRLQCIMRLLHEDCIMAYQVEMGHSGKIQLNLIWCTFDSILIG